MIDFNILKQVFKELAPAYGMMGCATAFSLLGILFSQNSFLFVILLLIIVGMTFNMTCVFYWEIRDEHN